MASVVVVGAGVAGLTCAWQLQRAGHDVEVIERESSAGGRMRSEAHGDFVIEHGALRFTAADANLHDLAAQLGLARCVHTHGEGDAVWLDGRAESVDLASPLRWLRSGALAATAKARLARLPVALLRSASELDLARPELAAALDDRSAAAGLLPLVGPEALERVLAPLLERVFGDDAAQVSFAAAQLALRGGVLHRRAQSFTGGNGLLTRSLARSLRVLYDCEVTSVETETDGARVRLLRLGRESRVFADAVVMAVPGTRVAALCPKLQPAERGFFESLRYTREISVQLLCDSAPRTAPRARIAFPRASGLAATNVTIAGEESGAARAGAAVLTATLSGERCDELWSADDADIVNRVRDELVRTSIGAVTPVEAFVQRWPIARPHFEPGRLRALAAFQRRIERSPRLVFAGDYLFGPRVEAAVSSGRRAASEIAREF